MLSFAPPHQETFRRTITWLTPLACALALSACGGAPSEQAIRHAVQQQVDASNAQIGNIGSLFGQPGAALGDKFKSTPDNFKKSAAKPMARTPTCAMWSWT